MFEKFEEKAEPLLSKISASRKNPRSFHSYSIFKPIWGLGVFSKVYDALRGLAEGET